VFEAIREAAETLRDESSGWVHRRDAADQLGRAAALALVALNDHRDEMDTDVRRAVDKALAQASAALNGVRPTVEAPAYTLEDLAHGCERKDRRIVHAQEDGSYIVEVLMKDGRRQEVHAEEYTRRDGIELLRVYSFCGPYADSTAKWALRANMKIAQGAIAVWSENGDERFVLLNCFLKGEASPSEFKASVKELAFFADWIEKKLNDTDEF
jgi:hypothetical protein